MKKIIPALLFLSLYIPMLHAQEYAYTHYTTKEGLAGETVYTSLQDRAGFLWIATETGLSRFDGEKFRNFTVADGLVANEVLALYEDVRGRLWIHSFSKELCYYKEGKIYNKYNDPLLRSLSFSSDVRGISGTKNEDVIIWDHDINVTVIDRNNRVKKYSPGTFQVDYTDLKNSNFINTSLLRMPFTPESLLRKYLSPYKNGNIFIKHNDGMGIFWAGNKMRSGFIILFFGTGLSYQIGNMNVIFQSFTEDGNLIGIRADGGACMYDIRKHRVTTIFLPNATINGIYEDRENNLWFNTKGDGVFKLSRPKMLRYTLDDKRNLPVQFIVRNADRVCVGTDNGRFWELNTVPGSLLPAHKTSIHPDVAWIHKNAPNQFIYYAHFDFLNLPQLPFIVLKSLYSFKDTLLLATNRGAFLHYKSKRYTVDTLYSSRTTTAIQYGDHYYIGTLDGLLVMDRQKHMLSKPLPYRISYFTPDKGTLWVATYDKGIFQLKNDTVIRAVNQQNSALTSNLCRCIYADGAYLWVGTDQGLHKIRLTDTNLTVEAIYNADNGLNSNVVNAVLARDSIVYVGTEKGLNIFNEKDAYKQQMFHLSFTGMSVADSAINLVQEPVLPYGNNQIKFEFSALSFSLNHIKYQYRLLGINTEWQIVSEQFLNFISLPSGNYTLQVQAIHPLGYKSHVIEKNFRVVKAIFEYWWFWAMVVLLCACVLLYVLRNRIRTIRKKEAEQSNINRRMVELEQMALRAQMNPHFIFNCLNSIQNYILKQDAAGANAYLSKFAGLVRKTLEYAPKIYISLQEEISYLTQYIELERLQANHPFGYTLTVDTRINPAVIQFPNMILQPLIENALKHGLCHTEVGMLKIDIALSDQGMLQCSIEDNGPGIDTVAKRHRLPDHNPKGLSLIYKRIETLNLIQEQPDTITLTIENLQMKGTQGTRVLVSLPFNTVKLINNE